MDIHDATETAYKNGYEAGYKKRCEDESWKLVSECGLPPAGKDVVVAAYSIDHVDETDGTRFWNKNYNTSVFAWKELYIGLPTC